MTVVSRDRDDATRTDDRDYLKNMVRHYTDDPRCWTISRVPEMHPVAREVISFVSNANQVAHVATAPRDAVAIRWPPANDVRVCNLAVVSAGSD